MTSVMQFAGLVFTASTVLIGIAIVLIPPTWKSIHNALVGMPPAQQRAAFDARNFEDERYKRRACLLELLFWGCVFIAASIFLNLFGLVGIASTMFGFHWGPFVEENFITGVRCVFIGTGFFSPGVFLIGFVRVLEGMAFRLGRPSPLFITDGAFRRRQTKGKKRGK